MFRHSIDQFALALSSLQKTSGQSTPTIRSRANSICEHDMIDATERMDELERLLINAGFFNGRNVPTLSKHQVKPINN
jgi:hypothetical protein